MGGHVAVVSKRDHELRPGKEQRQQWWQCLRRREQRRERGASRETASAALSEPFQQLGLVAARCFSQGQNGRMVLMAFHLWARFACRFRPGFGSGGRLRTPSSAGWRRFTLPPATAWSTLIWLMEKVEGVGAKVVHMVMVCYQPSSRIILATNTMS